MQRHQQARRLTVDVLTQVLHGVHRARVKLLHLPSRIAPPVCAQHALARVAEFPLSLGSLQHRAPSWGWKDPCASYCTAPLTMLRRLGRTAAARTAWSALNGALPPRLERFLALATGCYHGDLPKPRAREEEPESHLAAHRGAQLRLQQRPGALHLVRHGMQALRRHAAVIQSPTCRQSCALRHRANLLSESWLREHQADSAVCEGVEGNAAEEA
jgi:hypothetical protein